MQKISFVSSLILIFNYYRNNLISKIMEFFNTLREKASSTFTSIKESMPAYREKFNTSYPEVRDKVTNNVTVACAQFDKSVAPLATTLHTTSKTIRYSTLMIGGGAVLWKLLRMVRTRKIGN